MKTGRLRHLMLVIVAGLTTFNCLGQISGRLLAPNGKPEAGAEVFINRSSYRAVTDDFGQFALLDVPAGFHEIVAYKKGFSLYRATMRVQSGRTYSLNIAFAATEKKGRGKSTDDIKATFDNAFLGPDGLLLYHPDTRVEVERMDEKFRVFSGPVVVDYPNAGYRITAYFNPNVFQSVTDAAYCYQEYQGSNVNQNMSVERTRLGIYTGSLRHWLTSLVAGTSRQEGFMELDAAGNPLSSPPVAAPSSSAGYSRIQLDQSIQVQFGDKGKTKVSAATPLDVNASGLMINSKALVVEGAMNQSGLDHQLPLDYKPIHDIEGTYTEALRFFYEKVYIQTDKPYYYPGEPLWFKAYVNYYNREWRDSLSDVLYVELLTAKEEVKVERMFKIAKGVSNGDFIVPDSLPEGTYYLRAYTNLRLNFGTKGLFTKPLRVLSPTDKADGRGFSPQSETSSVRITPNQQDYRVREKITLDLQLGMPGPGTNLSISVTDAAQVIAIPEPINILNAYPIQASEIPEIVDLTMRIENGVSFYGQFLNNKEQPEKTQLTFIQWKTGDVLTAETGDDGMFWQTGLQFYDSARFSYKSDKAKGRPYGKVSVLPRVVPPLEAIAAPDFEIVKAGSVQRIFSEYEVPKDSKLLEGVEVRGQRAEDSELEQSKKRPYGRADHVITSKNLNVNSGNLLYALAGKVPGLVVNPSQGVVYFSRALGNSITQSANPMVTINDVPMAGDAGTILLSIDFNTIESIEFTNRFNALYGAQGASGVISVYTKTGMEARDTTDPNFQTIKLPGYSQAREFRTPSHDQPTQEGAQPDYRSTVYWHPDLRPDPTTGTATVTFFASDLAGLYRVVVEGIDADGKPVRAVTYLTISER